MKSNNNYGILLIFILISSNLIQFSKQIELLNIRNILNKDKKRSITPSQILSFSDQDDSPTLDKKLQMNIKGLEPLKYLELKRDLFNIISPNSKKKRIKFGHSMVRTNLGYKYYNIYASFKELQPNDDSTTKMITPSQIGKLGNPINKEYNSEDEVVPIYKVFANSIYKKINADQVEESFDAQNILTDENFWCSAGLHGLKEEVIFNIEFNRSYRINAMWIQWAFGPGKFQINYSNDDTFGDNKKWINLREMTDSFPERDIVWWKSILSNPKNRWKYRSFDNRVDFQEPVWAKYIQIIMTIPVNQYYGIYKVEVYTKTKSIVMIRSKTPGENLCLSTINGQMTDYSPVIAIDCLQAIGYGDNRDLLIINSNGYITTLKGNKCVESPNTNSVNIIECGTAATFKDEREKWILDYDGKIRSSKEPYSCLTIEDESFEDYVPNEFIRVKASSQLNDNIHEPIKVLDYDNKSYWSSSLTNTVVIFEVYFIKCPFIIKQIEIEWKFPAKKFKVIGLLTDNYWKEFGRENNNDKSISFINFSNSDLVGIKIQMIESTVKFEEKSIYAIHTLSLHTGVRFLRREPCKEILYSVNIWELIDVKQIDNVTSFEKRKAQSELHKTNAKFKIMTELYEKIPDSILRMKERSSFIRKNIFNLHTSYEDTQNKIIRFLDFLKDEKVTIYSLGANEYFPAYDCSSIIRAFPSKRSGFYWIKNDCNPQAERVFCDFDIVDKTSGLDFFVYNENQAINTPINVKNYKDIRLLCGKLGFEPILIKNKRIIITIKKLLLKIGYNLKEKTIIPLAFDYNCEIAKCSGIYKSINSESSTDVTGFLKDNQFDGDELQFDYTKNIFEDSGEIIRNVAAFGINNRISYLKMEDYPISAIVCSTNKDGLKIENKTFEIECDTNLRGNLFENYELYTNLRLECPRYCGSEKFPIYGTGLYTDNSSICKAAIHSGIIKDSEGGKIEINLEPGKNSYMGSSAFNIDSLDYNNEWDRSFRVKKYIPYCPIDKLKEYEKVKSNSSFLQIAEKVDLNESNDDTVKVNYDLLYKILKNNKNFINSPNTTISTKSNLKNDVKKNVPENFLEKHKNLIKYYPGFMKFLELLSEDEANKILPKDTDFQNSQIEISHPKKYTIKDIEEMLKNNQDTNKLPLEKSNESLKSRVIVQHLINSTNSTDNIFHQTNVFDNRNLPTETAPISTSLQQSTNDLIVNKQPKSDLTTELAIISIKTIRERENRAILRIKKTAEEFKTLVGKAVYQTKILTNDKELGLNSQKKVLSNLIKKIMEIQKKIYEINRKCNQKMTKTEEHLKNAKDKINSFLKRDSFIEDYSAKDILDNYEIFNSKKGSGSPSKWEYYMYNLNGHIKTIMQKDSFIDNRTGSHLVIKNRDYYDFELKFSVMIKDKNTFGVAFRYSDPFNYYIFQMSTTDKGFKKVSKYLKGSETMIDIKYDGGYMIDTWYNFKIRGKQSLIQIYMTDQTVDIGKKYELIFQFTDNEIVHGTVAFASQGLNFVLIDNINIIPIPCTNYNSNSNDYLMVITPSCPRYDVVLDREVIQEFTVIDPLKSIDGPSAWERVENVEDREMLLAQKSLISAENDNEEGTLIILKEQTKICTVGRISFKFKAMNDGIVGIVFRFNEKGDYYIIEISGEKEKFIRMRKKTDGVYQLVSQLPLKGYVKKRWYRVVVYMNQEKFNVYMTDIYLFENLNKIFEDDIVDSNLKFGLLGLSTYKTAAFFEEINLSPFDDLESIVFLNIDNQDLVFVDEEILDLPTTIKKSTKQAIDSLNTHLKNFTWQKCIMYPLKEERIRFCDLLFNSKFEIDKCKDNFCDSCCKKNVDVTNRMHLFICNKQCVSSEIGNEIESSFKMCSEPKNQESSIYPYCDKLHENDFYQKTQCKIDMCNLCCISIDTINKTNMPKSAIDNCYSNCIKKFDKSKRNETFNLRSTEKAEREITKLFKAKNIFT